MNLSAVPSAIIWLAIFAAVLLLLGGIIARTGKRASSALGQAL